jgi:hypothetical protein
MIEPSAPANAGGLVLAISNDGRMTLTEQPNNEKETA